MYFLMNTFSKATSAVSSMYFQEYRSKKFDTSANAQIACSLGMPLGGNPSTQDRTVFAAAEQQHCANRHTYKDTSSRTLVDGVRTPGSKFTNASPRSRQLFWQRPFALRSLFAPPYHPMALLNTLLVGISSRGAALNGNSPRDPPRIV